MSQLKFKIFGKQVSIEDKTLHVWAGMSIALFFGGGIYFFTAASYFLSCFLGFLIGSIIGILKEWFWDGILKKGVTSNEDALATVYGSFAGAILLAMILGAILTCGS